MYHATKAMRVETMPPGWTARILFLIKSDGGVEPYAPLVAYMADHWSRSTTWQDTVARGVGLLWDWFRANGANADDNSDVRRPLRRMFKDFARALVTGTIDPETAYDPLGLYWPHMPRARAVTLLRSIENFLAWYQGEWLDRPDTKLLRASQAIVPDNALTFTDVLVWSRLRMVSFLSHLNKTPTKIRRAAEYDVGREPNGAWVKPAKAFPAERTVDLIVKGHARPTGRHASPDKIRDQMIALLCAFGGLRRSEALHLFTTDVTLDPERPGCALVVLHHPSEAPFTYLDVFGAEVTVTRKEYLAREFGLLPRHQVMRGRYHVGWKGMELDEHGCAIVHWLDELAGRAFWEMYGAYVEHRRAIMDLRKAARADETAQGGHPFLFVAEGSSRHEGRRSTVGDPYSAQAYERNHRAAVKRLGLPYGKRHGTSTHGLRHRYGRDLMERGLTAPVIQKALRQRHALSQVVYTAPSNGDTSRLLAKASERLRAGEPISYDLLGGEDSLALYALSRHITSRGYNG